MYKESWGSSPHQKVTRIISGHSPHPWQPLLRAMMLPGHKPRAATQLPSARFPRAPGFHQGRKSKAGASQTCKLLGSRLTHNISDSGGLALFHDGAREVGRGRAGSPSPSGEAPLLFTIPYEPQLPKEPLAVSIHFQSKILQQQLIMSHHSHGSLPLMVHFAATELQRNCSGSA